MYLALILATASVTILVFFWGFRYGMKARDNECANVCDVALDQALQKVAEMRETMESYAHQQMKLIDSAYSRGVKDQKDGIAL